ncbi:MAG: penicillin acylase family protein, partial [Amphiplicatus sp.]|nr:penicillin acylase family protein [Amphiplicatus sp.]
MLKLVLRLAAGLVGLLVVALIAGVFWLRSSAPSLSGEYGVEGLSAKTSIVRDEYGVPHIFAENVEDAYTALGFVHAQDRLVQMEFLRWVAQGRLAEKVGASGVDTDKLSKTLNLKKIGELSLARADAETVRAFQKYANGVNAYIDSHKGAWPLEFVLLGETPEKWSAADVFSLSGLILFAMPDWQDELVHADFSRQLSAEQMDEFFPLYPENAPVTYSASVAPSKEARSANPAGESRHAGWPFAKGGFASNTWVVAGSRTKSGLPILASDPHGGFTAPIDYYLSRIEGPGFSFRGVGSPGFPAYMMGHNSKIAWGLTDLGADVADLFLERTIDADTYEGPDGPLPFTVREEVIKVKGGEDITLKVRETRHGPVISDVHKGAADYAATVGPEYAVALSMEASKRGVNFSSAMFHVNKAQNWNEFVAALEGYDFQQNFSFADREGNIGMVSAARLPEKDGSETHMPREGWLADNDWKEVKSVATILHEENPAQGFIANANNRLTPYGSSYEAS